MKQRTQLLIDYSFNVIFFLKKFISSCLFLRLALLLHLGDGGLVLLQGALARADERLVPLDALRERVHLGLHLDVAEGPPAARARGGQRVVVAGGGVLDGLEGHLGREATDADRQVVGRAGGRAERRDLLLEGIVPGTIGGFGRAEVDRRSSVGRDLSITPDQPVGAGDLPHHACRGLDFDDGGESRRAAFGSALEGEPPPTRIRIRSSRKTRSERSDPTA